MAKLDELAAQVEQMRRVLESHGIRPPAQPVAQADRADYIAHGSAQHAAFLGLVEVGKGDETITLATYTSPRTGRTFRLEDELGAVRFYPSIDPQKAMLLVLQQKVNELEMPVQVPDDAPEMFRPAAVYPT
jgi:hypothetical protein